MWLRRTNIRQTSSGSIPLPTANGLAMFYDFRSSTDRQIYHLSAGGMLTAKMLFPPTDTSLGLQMNLSFIEKVIDIPIVIPVYLPSSMHNRTIETLFDHSVEQTHFVIRLTCTIDHSLKANRDSVQLKERHLRSLEYKQGNNGEMKKQQEKIFSAWLQPLWDRCKYKLNGNNHIFWAFWYFLVMEKTTKKRKPTREICVSIK